jgi:hypothetical protein
MNDPDSISDPVVRRIRYTGSYPSARGSARLAADEVAGGSYYADVSADWTLTWHANAMLTSSLSGSGTWVGSSGIRVGSAHPGEEDAWRASVRVASHPAGV